MNYVVCLSDTGSSCHVTVMGSLIVLVNKRADWNVPISYIKYMSPCSACGFSTKKFIKSTQFWKWSFSNILLFYLDVVWFIDGQDHDLLKPTISGFYICFHPVYRPCFYLIWKHMTPFYRQQKLLDNRDLRVY